MQTGKSSRRNAQRRRLCRQTGLGVKCFRNETRGFRAAFREFTSSEGAIGASLATEYHAELKSLFGDGISVTRLS